MIGKKRRQVSWSIAARFTTMDFCLTKVGKPLYYELRSTFFGGKVINPEQRLNADLKHRLRSRVQVRTKEKLPAATKTHMQEIKAQPKRVMAYFSDPNVK
jgi:hypothetical protein